MVFLTLCAVAVYSQSSNNSQSFNSSNAFLDSVLSNNLPQEIENAGQKKIRLPEFETDFTDKVGLVTSKVKNEFEDGKLEGLSSMQRLNNCSNPVKVHGNAVINCTLEFSNLKMKFDVDIKYGKLPTVDADIKTKIENTRVEVEIVSNEKSNYPTIKSFRLVNLGDLRNTFSGLGPLNKYLTSLEEGYTRNVKVILQRILEEDLRSTLTRATVRTPMPLP